MGVRWDLGLIDPYFLSTVILINGVMRTDFGRNNGLLRGLLLRLHCPGMAKIEQ